MNFSSRSEMQLSTCSPQLVAVARRALAISPVDFTILEGHRGKVKQNAAYESGHSKVRWPNGNHNKFPSDALDFLPYPWDWDDQLAFFVVAWSFRKASQELDIPIRWGGDWDSDKNIKEERFWDLGHVELSAPAMIST